jgi:hypothetical protein
MGFDDIYPQQPPPEFGPQHAPPDPFFVFAETWKDSFSSIFSEPQTGQLFINPFEYSSGVAQISNTLRQSMQV